MSEGPEIVAKLRKARTAYHEAYGVPISPEYARFLEAIGECTDFIERYCETCPNCKIGDPREFRNGEWQHYIIADEPHWIKCGNAPAPEVELHGWQKTLGRADVCPCHGMTNCQLYD